MGQPLLTTFFNYIQIEFYKKLHQNLIIYFYLDKRLLKFKFHYINSTVYLSFYLLYFHIY